MTAARLLPAAALAAALASPASAERLRLDYTVYVGGIAMLDAQVDLDVTGERYDMTVSAATDGFMARMVSWKGQSRSSGSLAAGDLAPARHQVSSVWRGEPRSVRLDYDGRGGLTAAVEPPPGEEDREPVPDTLRRGTVDPLTAVLSMVRAAGRGEPCTRSIPVYDGRRRYDLLFQETGTRELAPNRYSVFAGTARQCRAGYTPIAGYSKRRPSPWQSEGNPDERPPTDLWMAKVGPRGTFAPVRVETSSGFGSVVVHLTNVVVQPETAEKP